MKSSRPTYPRNTARSFSYICLAPCLMNNLSWPQQTSFDYNHFSKYASFSVSQLTLASYLSVREHCPASICLYRYRFPILSRMAADIALGHLQLVPLCALIVNQRAMVVLALLADATRCFFQVPRLHLTLHHQLTLDQPLKQSRRQ